MIASKEGCNARSSLIEDIVQSSNGDLRQALHSLQVGAGFSLRQPKNGKKTWMVGEQKDVEITLFHTVGKFLYCKRAGTVTRSVPTNVDHWISPFCRFFSASDWPLPYSSNDTSGFRKRSRDNSCDTENVMKRPSFKASEQESDSELKRRKTKTSVGLITDSRTTNSMGTDFVPKYQRPPPEAEVEYVLDHTSTNPSTLVDFLHENYVYFFDDIGDVACCCLQFAAADSLLNPQKIGGEHLSTLNFNKRRTDADTSMSGLLGLMYGCVTARAVMDCNLHPKKPQDEGSKVSSFGFAFKRPSGWFKSDERHVRAVEGSVNIGRTYTTKFLMDTFQMSRPGYLELEDVLNTATRNKIEKPVVTLPDDLDFDEDNLESVATALDGLSGFISNLIEASDNHNVVSSETDDDIEEVA
eukprot:Filipodium_phascolosomae@DN1402_c0_g1_i1.p1